MVDAVVAGHICLDIIPSLSSRIHFEPGRLVEAGEATLSTGGAVSNTGLALNKLGIDVRLIGKVGDDLFADSVRKLLDRHRPGLGSAMAVAERGFTSYTVVINLSGEDRMFLHAPGCNNSFGAEDVSNEVLSQARLMHFGYPPLMERMYADEGRELESLMRKAKAAGCATSLDMSLPDPSKPSGQAPWHRILERVLPFVDLFLPSQDEIAYMLGRSRDAVPNDLAGVALNMGAKIVGIKLGERGLFVRTAESLDMGPRLRLGPAWNGVELLAPCFEVDVAGTTGSGDATIAGFLMGVLRGFAPEMAAQAGVAVGGCCCECADSTSGIRSWPETEARIRAGWRQRCCERMPTKGENR